MIFMIENGTYRNWRKNIGAACARFFILQVLCAAHADWEIARETL